jgi:hypothetical protein
MAAVAYVIWGGTAVFATVILGLLATGIQLYAPRLVRKLVKPAADDMLRTYVVGMGLRVAGVVILGVLVTIDRATFPPGPAALGFLGVILPLLWLETRLA